MNKHELYVVQRLPEYYQWQLNATGKRVELFSCADKRLVGFKLLSSLEESDAVLMNCLSAQLTDVAVDNFLIEIGNEHCLFVQEYDSSIVLRLFKNMGVAIADETN